MVKVNKESLQKIADTIAEHYGCGVGINIIQQTEDGVISLNVQQGMTSDLIAAACDQIMNTPVTDKVGRGS